MTERVDTDTTPQKRPRGRIRAVLALGSVVGIGAVATLAAWTDTGDVAASFSTGSLDLTFDDGQDGNPNPYELTSLSLSGGAPGDAAIAPLQVNNDGTVDFTYSMMTTISALPPGDEAEADALAAELELTVVAVADTASCTADAFTDPADEVVAPVTLPDGEIAEPGRALAADATEVLCYRVTFGDDVPQDSGATATFEFTATQS